MSAFAIACITFACVFGGALFGMFLRGVLPITHLGEESRDIVKLGAGLIATMSALVLSLLIASAKSSFDIQNGEVRQAAADVMLLDGALARYGPETREIRDLIRNMIAYRLSITWPEDASQTVKLEAPEINPTMEGIGARIRALKPSDDDHRWLLSRALELIASLERTRWLLFGGQGDSLQIPFLVVLIFWVTVIFTSFGLFAPRNGTVFTVLLISALSIAASIYLIVELDRPFTGLMKISSAPLRYTLAHLGQ